MPYLMPINPVHSATKHTLSASAHASEYHNHLGAVDNFLITEKSGTGDCTVDTSNHKMVLTSGVGVGNSYFRSATLFGIPALPIVVNCRFMISTLADGAGGTRNMYLGLFDTADQKGIYFHQKDDDTWECVSKGDTTTYTAAITAITTGQFLDIVYNQTGCRFYVDGVVVAALAYDATSANLTHGAYIQASGAVSGARTIDIDYFGLVHSSGGVV